MPQVSDSVRRAKPLLGTVVEIQIQHCQRRVEKAIEAAFDAVADVHKLMSFHHCDSDVSRLNRGAFHAAVKIASSTYSVLETAVDLYRQSHGLFDVTIAAQLQRMGLLPHMGETVDAPARTSSDLKLLSDGYVRYRRDGVCIDLGGIAKGFAVDRAVDVLKNHGVESGLVSAGGDMRAFGLEAYEVSIRNPADPTRLLLRTSIRDEALASSGRRFDLVQSANVLESAVIDPVHPTASCSNSGATVRAVSCIHADALTKIVMLATDQSGAILEHYGASALVVKANGDVFLSAPWKEIEFLAA